MSCSVARAGRCLTLSAVELHSKQGQRAAGGLCRSVPDGFHIAAAGPPRTNSQGTETMHPAAVAARRTQRDRGYSTLREAYINQHRHQNQNHELQKQQNCHFQHSEVCSTLNREHPVNATSVCKMKIVPGRRLATRCNKLLHF